MKIYTHEDVEELISKAIKNTLTAIEKHKAQETSRSYEMNSANKMEEPAQDQTETAKGRMKMQTFCEWKSTIVKKDGGFLHTKEWYYSAYGDYCQQQRLRGVVNTKLRENEDEQFLINKVKANKTEYLKLTGDTINKLNVQLEAERAKLAEAHAMIVMLREALEFAEAGSCHCQTKTPDAAHHSEYCQYRVISEALAATAETVEALSTHRDNYIRKAERERIAEFIMGCDLSQCSDEYKVFIASLLSGYARAIKEIKC